MQIFVSRDHAWRVYRPHFPRSSVLGKIERASIEQARAPLPRWYGVATGDGNNGVSHMWPEYYVFTSDPWRLAECAAKSSLKPGVEFEVDGEAEYMISAVVYDDPSFYDDYDPDADYSDLESGPAPFILDVFPADPEENPYGRLCYGSISEAFGE